MVERAEDPSKYRRQRQKLAGPTLTILILISALLIDSLLSDVSSIINRTLSQPARIVLFSTIVAVAVVTGGRSVLYNSNKVKDDVGSKNKAILSMSRIMPIIQYTIIGLLILITLQIIFTSEYLNFFLVASLALS
jgi:hypothetical protein